MPGRPKGARDKQPRKVPDRAHLRTENRVHDARARQEMARLEQQHAHRRHDADNETPSPERNTDEHSKQNVRQILTAEQERHRLPVINYPATIVCIGKKFAGKTTAELNLINPNDFDDILVITKTKHKHNLDSLVKNENYIFDNCSEDFIQLILDHQAKHMSRVLVLFDDFIGMDWDPLSSKKLKLLGASSRNFNLTVWFSSQDLTQVPTIIRRNAEYLLLGNNYESTNKLLAEQLALPAIGKPQFRAMLDDISKNMDHEFMFIDDRNQDWWIWKPEHVPGLDNSPADIDTDKLQDSTQKNSAESVMQEAMEKDINELPGR